MGGGQRGKQHRNPPSWEKGSSARSQSGGTYSLHPIWKTSIHPLQKSTSRNSTPFYFKHFCFVKKNFFETSCLPKAGRRVSGNLQANRMPADSGPVTPAKTKWDFSIQVMLGAMGKTGIYPFHLQKIICMSHRKIPSPGNRTRAAREGEGGVVGFRAQEEGA